MLEKQNNASMGTLRIFWIAICVVAYMLFLGSMWLGAQTRTWFFDEKLGNERRTGAYSLKMMAEGRVQLFFANARESQELRLDAKGQTTSWECRLLDGRGYIRGMLQGGNLVLRGRLDGKELIHDHPVEGLSWLQAPDYQLGLFARSGAAGNKHFWVVNPDDFRPYHMEASLRGTEKITLRGVTFRAQRVVMTISGMPELFWSNQFWYDAVSGQYLKFTGRRGPPWSPLLEMEFLREQ